MRQVKRKTKSLLEDSQRVTSERFENFTTTWGTQVNQTFSEHFELHERGRKC